MIPARGGRASIRTLTQGLENVTWQDQQWGNTGDLSKAQQSKQLQCLMEEWEHSLWETEAQRRPELPPDVL